MCGSVSWIQQSAVVKCVNCSVDELLLCYQLCMNVICVSFNYVCVLLRCFGIINKCSVTAVMGDRLATIDMSRNEGGSAMPFSEGGVLLSATVRSGILIHPAVWPRTWVADYTGMRP